MSEEWSAEIEPAPPKPFGINGGLAVLAFFFIMQSEIFFSAIMQDSSTLFELVGYVPKRIAENIAVFYYLELARGAIVASLSYIAGLTLLKGLKEGRKIANIALLSAVSLSIVPFLSIRLFPDEVRSALLDVVMGDAVRGIVFPIILGLYLNFSRRCKNTYETDYPIPPAKSWLWTGCRIFFGGVLALSLIAAAHSAGKMRNATTGNIQTIPNYSVPADKISLAPETCRGLPAHLALPSSRKPVQPLPFNLYKPISAAKASIRCSA